MAHKAFFGTLLSMLAAQAAGQFGPAAPHNTGFNSTFTFTVAQIEAAQLDGALVESLQAIIDFDRTQLAFGGPRHDDFYRLPPLTNTSGPLAPGQVIKVQEHVDASAFALPPHTSLSRLLYTSRNANGTVIPTSGFVLWPYLPRGSSDGKRAKMVVWTHGTSGFFAPQAPSAHRGLWYDEMGPFALAQAGYAVFAPDYHGLGVSASWDGSPIWHQYLMWPSLAADALHGVSAARAAFPHLLDGDDFVVIGHSQGGGAAWAVAEALADGKNGSSEFAGLRAGYRGTVALSPMTELFAVPTTWMAPTSALSLASVFPDFEVTEWMTPLGAARLRLAREVDAGLVAFQQLLPLDPVAGMVRPDWNESWYGAALSDLAGVGRRDFAGPLLVIQGDEDVIVAPETTIGQVERAWRRHPKHDLELLVAESVGHTSLMLATRQLWLRWVDDRLQGVPLAKKGPVWTDVRGMLSKERYLAARNSFPLWAGLPQFSYEVPLP
ncbi:hypothetical protein MAPG_06102 [Magnaporthiopsis poae ATCC 64411]|uniref:Serine aminopeptidase S33 domain-containing protein n=1 Tax=Magnaporthiopsis poae (strain ATCC 64411 / 73-15) TaxID=644358 RepID=A0A0C4E154_MAGP6|nr:hypothetical protein MAPG_06102 [Magnaporthiopsis poae ATCC 64411]